MVRMGGNEKEASKPKGKNQVKLKLPRKKPITVRKTKRGRDANTTKIDVILNRLNVIRSLGHGSNHTSPALLTSTQIVQSEISPEKVQHVTRRRDSSDSSLHDDGRRSISTNPLNRQRVSHPEARRVQNKSKRLSTSSKKKVANAENKRSPRKGPRDVTEDSTRTQNRSSSTGDRGNSEVAANLLIQGRVGDHEDRLQKQFRKTKKLLIPALTEILLYAIVPRNRSEE